MVTGAILQLLFLTYGEFIISTYSGVEVDRVLKDLVRVNTMVSFIIEEALKDSEVKIVAKGKNIFSIGSGLPISDEPK